MVWEVTFTCDICGQKKGEGNHWWMVALRETRCPESAASPLGFTLVPWSVEESRASEHRHLCGQNCALQALERFMNSGSLEHEASS